MLRIGSCEMVQRESLDLNQYRKYLYVLADMQLNPRHRTKEDVSDVVQVTLMRAHKEVAQFRGETEAELRVWLKTILTRTLINIEKKYRTQKRDHRIERSIDHRIRESSSGIRGNLATDDSSPSLKLIRQECAERLAEALTKLTSDEYSAVTLKHIHDWKIVDIAVRLERTPHAVTRLLQCGLRKLRIAMQSSS